MTSMVHEFRTPINSIVMLSKLLMEDQQREDGSRHRDISSKIHHVGNSLLEVINNYLDYSKTFAGMSADLHYVDLNRVRSSMEGMFYAKSRLKGLTFRWNMDSQISGKVYTDRFLLEQVLKNLLSNAFKYTEAGGVEVRVSFRRSDARDGSGGVEWGSCDAVQDSASAEDGASVTRTGGENSAAEGGHDAVNSTAAGEGSAAVTRAAGTAADAFNSSSRLAGILSISISDTGIGISNERQQAIFEAYQQADDKIHSLFGGTGLGLSIARKAADLLKGTITVESEPGKGSTFTFSHPVELLLTDEPTGSAKKELDKAETGRPVKTGSAKTDPDRSLTEPIDPASDESDPEGVETEWPVNPGSAKKELDRAETRWPVETGSAETDPDRAETEQVISGSAKNELDRAETGRPVKTGSAKTDPDQQVTKERSDAGLSVRYPVYSESRAEAIRAVQERWVPYSHGDEEVGDLSFSEAKVRRGATSGTILLIDDSALHSTALREYLEPSVETVLQAKSAEVAFHILERRDIDTVILDMTLPDASGEEVLAKIRKNPAWCHIRVIIYTGLPISDRRLKQPRKLGIPIITKSVNSYRKLKDTVL